MNLLTADIVGEGIDQEMKSLALAEDITNQYLTQGQHLGQLQRGYSAFPIEMSQKDIERRTAEELGYAELAGGLLSNNPPQHYFEPNIWSQIGGGMTDVGSMMLMGDMLKGGTTTPKLGGGRTFPSNIRTAA